MSSLEKQSLISGTPVVASQPLPAGAPPAYTPYAQVRAPAAEPNLLLLLSLFPILISRRFQPGVG